jgi:16S rRNA (uracil1498-N3)-methyltransferase
VSGPADAGGAAHAVVADVDEPQLEPEDRHHLARVLRLRPGTPFTVTDGFGRWRLVGFDDPLRPLGPAHGEPAPEPAVTVAFALLKGDKNELVVQKLTEVGVDGIVVFPAERSVARWTPDKQGRQLDRLRRVVREAVMQSRRAWMPTVSWVPTFDEVAARPGVCRADRGGSAIDLSCPTVLVGPEGGWSEAERAVPLPVVTLGGHVLRAETASMVAGALLVVRRDLEH